MRKPQLFTLDENNGDDVLDSRDIIDRIEDLESREDYSETGENADESLTEDEREELTHLREFAKEAARYASDWDLGETLIHDSHFTDYIAEWVVDSEYLPADLPEFISSNIDWKGVADDLKGDYSPVELDGETYWIQ